jgi:hypothetical protein
MNNGRVGKVDAGYVLKKEENIKFNRRKKGGQSSALFGA